MAPQASTSAALAVNTMIIRSLCRTGRLRYRIAMFIALFPYNLREAQQLRADMELLLRRGLHVDLNAHGPSLDPEVDHAPFGGEVVAFPYREHAGLNFAK